MDTLDWIIAVVFALLFGAAGYFIFEPYGAFVGVGLAALLVWRAKTNRDRLRRKEALRKLELTEQAMGGEDKVARQHSRGKLDARARIAGLKS